MLRVVESLLLAVEKVRRTIAFVAAGEVAIWIKAAGDNGNKRGATIVPDTDSFWV